MNTIRFACILAACLSFTLPLRAEDYGYHPKSILYLGGGFDPEHPASPFLSCLEPITAVPDDIGAATTKFSGKLITRTQDVFDFLHVDASLSARYLFISATASFSLDDQSALHDDSLTWIIRGETNYGAESVQNEIKLNAPANALKQSPPQFYARCGKEVVLKQVRLSQIALTFTIHNISQDNKSKLTASFSGSASDPITGNGGSLSVNFSKFLSNATKTGDVDVSVYILGGEGISRLSNIVLNSDNFDAIRQTAADYVSKLSRSNSGIVDYFTNSWSVFGVGSAQDFSVNPVVTELFYNYSDYLTRFQRLGDILRNADTKYAYLDQAQLETYNQQYKSIGDYLATVRRRGIACLGPSNTCTQGAEQRPDTVRWPVEPDIGCARWYRGQCYVCDFPVALNASLAGASLTYTCQRMPNGTSVQASFEGYVVVDFATSDNKIWNGWSRISLQESGVDCPPNYNCTSEHRFSQTWDLLAVRRLPSTVKNGSSTWTLRLTACQTGPSAVSCDTIPPGQAAPNSTASPVIPAHLKIEVTDPNILRAIPF